MSATDAAIDRADAFLNQYRALEEELCRKYDIDEKTFGSAVVRFLNDKESKPYREKLDLCREIRNLLSHHSEVDGERIVEPANSMIEFLKEVTDYVSRPPLALDFSTLYADILKTSPSQKVKTVMKKMERSGFSHVPVVENGRFMGVFSVSTIFTYSLVNNMTEIREEMTVRDFGDLILTERHTTESFRFVDPQTTLYDVRQMFDRKTQHSKRLAAVFITENGSSEGRILGMLTPWDVIQ